MTSFEAQNLIIEPRLHPIFDEQLLVTAEVFYIVRH